MSTTQTKQDDPEPPVSELASPGEVSTLLFNRIRDLDDSDGPFSSITIWERSYRYVMAMWHDHLVEITWSDHEDPTERTVHTTVWADSSNFKEEHSASATDKNAVRTLVDDTLRSMFEW